MSPLWDGDVYTALLVEPTASFFSFNDAASRDVVKRVVYVGRLFRDLHRQAVFFLHPDLPEADAARAITRDPSLWKTL